MRRFPKALILVAAVAAVVLGHVATSARAAVTRTVHIMAADLKGVPITDLTAADLVVKEGGKEQKITSLQPATGPMQIAMVVDDGGTGAFQAATLNFMNKLLDQGQFSIRLLNTQALKILDYSKDTDALKTALGKMGQRGRVQPDGDQLVEAVGEAARELKQRKAERPVIVAFTVYGDSPKAVDPEVILADVKHSGASLNVMYVTGAATGQIIGDGPKQSGGRCDEVPAGGGIVPAAVKMADTLAHQMVLTYALADGVKPNDRLSITLNRKGVTLIAPTRITDKVDK